VFEVLNTLFQNTSEKRHDNINELHHIYE